MAITETEKLQDLAQQEYKYGFFTDIEADSVPPGLNEEVVRLISAKKNEPDFMLQWRLKAYRHWLTMKEPNWANIHYPPIDYQNTVYYSAPKSKQEGPKSLDEVDPELLETYRKLGIPLEEQQMLSGVAVDAVFDSVSVATTFKEKLADLGIIFCSFSEAVQDHPELVKKYLGTVVPYTDNFFASLNSAVFSDGSFCYVPKGVRCPMELSTYFRINARQHGTIRKNPDRRRPGKLCQLSGRMHGSPARRAPVACRCGGIDRPGRRPDQVFHHPELVSRGTKTAKAAFTTL